MVLKILGLTINCPPVLLFVVDRILIVLHYSVPGANPIVANDKVFMKLWYLKNVCFN